MRRCLAGLLIWAGTFAQQATITTTSQEVLLDLVVRDKKGHLVKDLRPDEITVTDDGAPQQIRSLRLRTGAEISTVQTTAAGGRQTTPRPAPATGVSVMNPLRDVRVVTFAFDPLPGGNSANERNSGSNAGGGDRRVLVKRVAEELLKADTGANFYWGVFLTGGGRVKIVQPYTTDKEKLFRAIDKAVMSPGVIYAQPSDVIAPTQAAPVTGVASGGASGPVSGAAEAAAAMAAVVQNMVEFEQDADLAQRGRDDFFALDAMIRGLQKLPGRKTLVYFTKGLIMLPDYHAQFDRLIANANRSNVTIYCVDPAVASTGFGNNAAATKVLNNASSASAANMTKRGGPVTRSEATVLEHAEQSIAMNPHLAPMKLAEDTGGFLIANLNDTGKIVQRLSEEINTYYELTYTPVIEKYDGSFRKIAVKVARPDVKVQSRSGYFALPYLAGQSLFSYEMPLLSALAATPAPKAVAFRTAVKYFRPSTEVVFDVPLDKITMVKDEAAKTFRCHISLLGLFKDSQGSIVKKVTRDVPVNNALANLEATRAGHFIYTQHVLLPPGKYTFEAAVLDRESENLSIGVKKQSVIVTAPTAPDELSLSSLTLVRKLGPKSEIVDAEDPYEFKDGRVTPELDESIKGGKGSSIAIFLVAYTSPSVGDAKLMIDFVQDGKVVARSEPPFPKPDAAGRVNYIAHVPVEELKPGQYEVYAKVFQGGKGVQERILIQIEN